MILVKNVVSPLIYIFCYLIVKEARVPNIEISSINLYSSEIVSLWNFLD